MDYKQQIVNYLFSVKQEYTNGKFHTPGVGITPNQSVMKSS